jgi:streptogramin lyase
MTAGTVFRRVPVLVAGALLVACTGGDADGPPGGTPPPVTPEATATVPPEPTPPPFDPELATYHVPAGSGPHDVAPARDGGVWYTAQRSGALGHLDPESGDTRHIPLGPGSRPHGVITGPDGAPRAYAVYVDERDAVWLTDFGGNAIWRFDPTAERFDGFPNPGDPGEVRQLLGRPGEVWAPESATDRLVVIRY